VHIPATVTVGGLRINHNESLLIRQILELCARIECIGISMAPMDAHNNRWFADHVLGYIEPCSDASGVGTEVSDLSISSSWEACVSVSRSGCSCSAGPSGRGAGAG
jgi:hypothetical protein